MVTADSVAMRVWPRAWVPFSSRSAKAETTSAGSPTSLKISIVSPELTTPTSGWVSRSQARSSVNGTSPRRMAWLPRLSNETRPNTVEMTSPRPAQS